VAEFQARVPPGPYPLGVLTGSYTWQILGSGGAKTVLLLLQDAAGRIMKALVLAGGQNRLRVVISGYRDAVDLDYVAGQWQSEAKGLWDTAGIITDSWIEVDRIFVRSRAAG
jgi:hypothetical protein